MFAPSSSQITSKVVDAKIEEDSLVSVTFDVTAAYPQLVEPEVVVIRPPKEWKQMQLERNQDADVYWLMQRLLPGRRVAGREWVKFLASTLVSIGFK